MIYLVLLYLSGAIGASTDASYKDIIERAQQLSLKQERKEAQQYLLSAIEKEKDIKTKSVLVGTLKKLSEIFYTDKAQKIFEQGNAQVRQKPTEALRAFKQVLELEPNNTKVLVSMGRTYLLLGQCRDSFATSENLEGLDPYSQDNFLLKIQAQTCLKEFDDLEQNITARDVKDPEIALHLDLALAQMSYFKGQFSDAIKYVQKAIKLNEGFPENYYWENQILEKMSKPSLESAKKYVKLCKTMSKTDLSKFEREPRLCQEYKGIETKIEEQNSEKRDIDG